MSEEYDKRYDTYIIAFCPDSNSFFVTNTRAYFWEYDKEFKTEKEGIEYFRNNKDEFIRINNEIMSDCIYGWTDVTDVCLEND